MSVADRISHKARELRGRVKRTYGRATGDPLLEAEGMAQQATGWLGGADQRLRATFRGRRRRRF